MSPSRNAVGRYLVNEPWRLDAAATTPGDGARRQAGTPGDAGGYTPGDIFLEISLYMPPNVPSKTMGRGSVEVTLPTLPLLLWLFGPTFGALPSQRPSSQHRTTGHSSSSSRIALLESRPRACGHCTRPATMEDHFSRMLDASATGR